MDLEIKNEIEKQNLTLVVYIRSRNKSFYKGPIRSLTALNDTGEFDVLPQHANFITLIKDYIILDKDYETEQKFDIESGVLSVLGENINAYIGV